MPLPVAIPAALAPSPAPAAPAPATQDDQAATTQGQPAAPAPAPAPAPEPKADGDGQHPDAHLDGDQSPQAEGQPKPKGVQKRLDEMRRQIGDQQRLNERLLDIVTQTLAGKKPEVPSADAQDGPPKRENFETYEEYIEAKTRFQVSHELRKAYTQAEQIRAREEHARRESDWQTREAKASEKYADYDEVVLENSDLDITPVMAEAIKVSEIGTDIAYYLGTHPDEATRIAKMSPAAQAAQIGKIEAKLESKPAETPKPKVSNAPPPTDPVKATAPNDEFDLSKARTQAEYEAMRAKQIKAVGGGRW